jgi:predicted RNase H-like nuclease
MIDKPDDPWFAGVDACRGGWLVAFVRPRRGEIPPPRIIQEFADILESTEKPRIVAVDIPIGLPEQSEVRGRAPEREVRPLLGKLKSSVFRVPSRRTIEVGADNAISGNKERYLHCCAIARSTSLDKKAFGKQSFCLFRKIIQVDRVLRTEKHPNQRVFEVHPELAFWRLNGSEPLSEPKKRKHRCYGPGVACRRRLLIKEGFPDDIVHAAPPDGADYDDLLDALACAAIARRIHNKSAQSFPQAYRCDAFDLRMAIWA